MGKTAQRPQTVYRLWKTFGRICGRDVDKLWISIMSSVRLFPRDDIFVHSDSQAFQTGVLITFCCFRPGRRNPCHDTRKKQKRQDAHRISTTVQNIHHVSTNYPQERAGRKALQSASPLRMRRISSITSSCSCSKSAQICEALFYLRRCVGPSATRRKTQRRQKCVSEKGRRMICPAEKIKKGGKIKKHCQPLEACVSISGSAKRSNKEYDDFTGG